MVSDSEILGCWRTQKMNLEKIESMYRANSPIQNEREWIPYLEFIETYFKNREILNPLIVEIGAAYNKQKLFYKEILDCEYIGIDIKSESKTDIIGDSKSPETFRKLKEKLNGRAINLLFIDGDHTYEGVKSDYLIYSSLVQDLIAFHDVIIYKSSVAKFWNELIEANKQIRNRTFITIGSWHHETYQMGTGIILLKK